MTIDALNASSDIAPLYDALESCARVHDTDRTHPRRRPAAEVLRQLESYAQLELKSLCAQCAPVAPASWLELMVDWELGQPGGVSGKREAAR